MAGQGGGGAYLLSLSGVCKINISEFRCQVTKTIYYSEGIQR